MKISEAVEKAIESGTMIYRKSIRREKGYHNTAIMPTNSYDTCILITFCDGKETGSCRNWNPTGADLMADDWELWGKKTGFEKTDSAVTKGITVNIQAVRDKVDNAIVAICDSILDVAENMKNKRSLVLAINEMDIVNQLSNLVDARSKLDDSTERQRLK